MQKPYPEILFGPLGKPDQVAYLVPDLAAAADQWSMLFGGADRWKFYSYNPQTLTRMSYRDALGAYSIRIAILMGGTPEIELVQSIEGPSIYEEWIERRGHGLHHFGYFVDSLEETSERLQTLGYREIQTGYGFGVDGDGGYMYFDTEEELGFMIEIIKLPQADPASEEPRGRSIVPKL